MRTLIVATLISFVVSLFLTPIICRWANRRGILDPAGQQRKVHAVSTPRLGGIAIVIAFFAPLVPLLVFSTSLSRNFLADPNILIGLICGGGAIACRWFALPMIACSHP